MEKRDRFYSENFSTTGIEPWLSKYAFEPIVKHIPSSVPPNALSLANHVAVWTVFIAAAAAPYLSPFYALLARVLAGAAAMAGVFLDCLDGMHARRTGQASRLGEVMDHWLDSINVPLFTAALILTLQLEPWTAVFLMILTTMQYNAQLVLYHGTGRFLHPPTSGIDGLVGIAFTFVGVGILFYFVPRETYAVGLGITAFAWATAIPSIRNVVWFYRRMKGLLFPSLVFILFCVMFGAAYLAGMMRIEMCLLAVAFISFRMTGTYVLRTVLRRPYNGIDWLVPLWCGVVVASHFLLGNYRVWGYPLQAAVPVLFVLYVTAANLFELFRHLGKLRADSGEAHEEASA